jgi:hypothetical protein
MLVGSAALQTVSAPFIRMLAGLIGFSAQYLADSTSCMLSKVLATVG